MAYWRRVPQPIRLVCLASVPNVSRKRVAVRRRRSKIKRFFQIGLLFLEGLLPFFGLCLALLGLLLDSFGLFVFAAIA